MACIVAELSYGPTPLFHTLAFFDRLLGSAPLVESHHCPALGVRWTLTNKRSSRAEAASFPGARTEYGHGSHRKVATHIFRASAQ
jgi:hypothetical protein